MGCEHLPVFKWGKTTEIVKVLLNPPDNVCTTQPVSIQHNCTFIVSLENLRGVHNLRADDCGVWKHRGLRKTWVAVDNGDNVISQHREHPPKVSTTHGHLYVVIGAYHSLQSSPDFRCSIVTLRGECEDIWMIMLDRCQRFNDFFFCGSLLSLTLVHVVCIAWITICVVCMF